MRLCKACRAFSSTQSVLHKQAIVLPPHSPKDTVAGKSPEWTHNYDPKLLRNWPLQFHFLSFLTRFLCLSRNHIFPEINNTFIYFSSSLKILNHLKDASTVKRFFPRDFLLINDSSHQNKIKNAINLGKVVHLHWLHSSLAGWLYRVPCLGNPVSSSFFFFLIFLLQEHISGTFHRRCSQSIFFLAPCLYAAVFFLSSCLTDSLGSMQNPRLNIVPSKWLGWYFLAFEELTSLLVNDMCFH